MGLRFSIAQTDWRCAWAKLVFRKGGDFDNTTPQVTGLPVCQKDLTSLAIDVDQKIWLNRA